MSDIVKLENVSFINDDYKVLDDISLEIKKNSMTCIIGVSGSGKSTLIKLMAGLVLPTSGNIMIHGFEIHKLHEKALLSLRRKVSFVFQNSALISNLSIKENVMLPLNFHFPKLKQKEKNEMAEDFLSKVGMKDSMNQRPAQLSSGEQKLVAVVRGLITKPELIFFDEPLGSLDSTSAKIVTNMIKEYSDKEKTSTVIVTYSKDIISRLSDALVVIDNKKVSTFDRKNRNYNYDSSIKDIELLNDIFTNSYSYNNGAVKESQNEKINSSNLDEF